MDHRPPQSHACHYPLPLHTAQKTPTYFHDSFNTHTLHKAFPGQSIHLSTSAGRSDTMCTACSAGTLAPHRGSSVGWEALARQGLRRLSVHALMFTSVANTPTKCLTTARMHLQVATHPWSKGHIKKKCLSPRGSLSHIGDSVQWGSLLGPPQNPQMYLPRGPPGECQ